jgi:hypothetical protein
MSFDGGNELWQVFTDEVSREAGPSGKMAVDNCFDPGGWDRASAAGM